MHLSYRTRDQSSRDARASALFARKRRVTGESVYRAGVLSVTGDATSARRVLMFSKLFKVHRARQEHAVLMHLATHRRHAAPALVPRSLDRVPTEMH